MSPQQLLAHYDRIADAPDAVSRLREFVLALAVQGKLVPQLDGDLCLDQALKASRKDAPQRAAGIGRMRWEPSSAIGDAETRDLPRGWVAARVNDTGFYINGLAFKPSDWIKKGVPIIRIQNLTDPRKSFNFAKGEFPDEVTVRDGDILVSWSATLDAFIWERGEGVLNQHIFRVLPDERLTRKGYLHLILRNAIRELGDGEHARGLVMTHIKRAPFLAHVVGLPPLQEQDRIIAKADELMALCDQLEAARTEREATRDRLAAASLARLNAPDPEIFAAGVRFALDALPSLTARANQFNGLRQAILNLAVRGKLVEQNNADEAVREGVIPLGRKKRSANETHHESSFALPPGWAWRALGSIAEQITDGEHATPQRISKPEIALVTAKNVRDGFMDYGQTDWVSRQTANKAWGRCNPAVNDLLMVCVGATTGRLTVLREPKEMVLVRSVALIRPSSEVSSDYLERAIRSPVLQNQIWANVKAAAQPCLYLNRIQALQIPLPPLAEQVRIVAKVDELMALCDQLEASLATADDTRRRLLDALLHEALVPVAKPSKGHARAAISGYLVSRLASKRNFGRTAHMKYLYLAESLLGLNLGGRYMRQAAGPLDTRIYELEKRAETAGWYTHSVEPLSSGNAKVSYQPGEALKAIAAEGVALLGHSRAEMDRLIDLMGDLKTESVEIIATLFAAWNDALLDGQTPDDNWIIKEVREHWHVSKQRFTPADLKKWLEWMRQNDVIPYGHLPRTMQQTTMEF